MCLQASSLKPPGDSREPTCHVEAAPSHFFILREIATHLMHQGLIRPSSKIRSKQSVGGTIPSSFYILQAPSPPCMRPKSRRRRRERARWLTRGGLTPGALGHACQIRMQNAKCKMKNALGKAFPASDVTLNLAAIGCNATLSDPTHMKRRSHAKSVTIRAEKKKNKKIKK